MTDAMGDPVNPPAPPADAWDDADARRRMEEVLLLGASDAAAAAAAGVPLEALRRRLEESAELRQWVEACRGRAESKLLKGVFDKDDWRAKAWVLERRFGEHYAASRGAGPGEEGGPAADDHADPQDEETARRLLGILEEAQQGCARQRAPAAEGAEGGRA